MNPNLLALMRFANPWLEHPKAFAQVAGKKVTRHYINRIENVTHSWPLPGKAHLVIGGRQVGKSTFLWKHFQARNLAPLVLNAEEPLVREWCQSPTLLLADLRGLLRPGMPVFIEEAQHLAEAGLILKGLVDGGLDHPLYVTGSSAYHLQSRTRESLAGRAVRLRLCPFSLQEVSTGLGDLPALVRAARIRELALRQFVRGGYPEAWLAESAEGVLAGLVEAFVVRDASDLFRIQHLEAFRLLLRLAAGQVGSLVNLSEWATLCGVSRTAVSAYLDLLVETHVLRLVRPFSGGRRSELTGRPKVFFEDNGIRNAVLDQHGAFEGRLDRGALLENWVAAELGKRLSPLAPDQSLRFWRSKAGAEVDFVLERGGSIFGLEVKAAGLTRPQLSRSARSFIEAYAPARFCVLNLDLTARQSIGPTEVVWIGPEALCDPDFPFGQTVP